MSTRGLTYTTSRLLTQRRTPSCAHRATRERASTQGSSYTCPSRS